MDFKIWLSEMPMQNFQRIGDWNPSKKPTNSYEKGKAPSKGYHKDDFGILTSDAGVEKIKKKWSKCPEPFNVFVLRSKEGAKVREEGEVNKDYLATKLKLSPEIINQIANPNTINVVFTNNTGAERMPMTAWIMAHRVGHAIRLQPAYQDYLKIFKREMYVILNSIYNYEKKPSWHGYNPENEKMLLALANGIGSMRSARERSLRNLGEFYHEVLAQYIIEGKITFRPLPRLLTTHFTYGRPQGIYMKIDQEDKEGWDENLAEPHEIMHYASAALGECIGKIFVM